MRLHFTYALHISWFNQWRAVVCKVYYIQISYCITPILSIGIRYIRTYNLKWTRWIIYEFFRISCLKMHSMWLLHCCTAARHCESIEMCSLFCKGKSLNSITTHARTKGLSFNCFSDNTFAFSEFNGWLTSFKRVSKSNSKK